LDGKNFVEDDKRCSKTTRDGEETGLLQKSNKITDLCWPQWTACVGEAAGIVLRKRSG
jgi:hypothetical protein